MLRNLTTLSVFALALAACGGGDGADDGGGGGGSDGGGGGVDGATEDGGGGGGMDGGGTDGGGGGWGEGGVGRSCDSTSCVVTQCGTRTTECGDCIDNDMDGLSDSCDPECLGPCDNTEGPILLAGVGGETGGPCQSDCYFDFGNGSGNDDCFWDHRCDTLEVSPSYHPEGMLCEYDATLVDDRTCPAMQSATCLDVCRPLTPNGCDCFGCCTFDAIDGRSAAMGGEYVWLGSVVDGTNDGTCTLADVTDTSLCRPCTPVADCFNDCGRCELCVGRDTLPPECVAPPPPPPGTDGGPPPMWDGGVPPPRCDPGVQPCGLASDPACAAGYYCVTGCCVSTLI
jgi:hypothetical protein